MNAFKHGMRSKKQALLRDDSIAFENRLHRWMAIADPDDDMGEFLVHQNVCMSFEVERVRRAHLEGLTSQIENSDDTEHEAVHELGKRLFFDPSGPSQLYGNPGVVRRKLRTSWNGLAVDPNDPAVLVRKLESSEPGCRQMREVWEDLRAQLEPPKSWQSHHRLKAIRLLGRQPLDAIEDRRVAEIFVASHALNPVGESPFDDLQSDLTTTALARYREDVKAQWPDLVSTTDTARCRQILIDLADRNIERLNGKLELLEALADANAERTVARLSVDQSPDGQRLRAYHMKCVSALNRGFETFRKYQGKKKAEGRDRKDEYAGMMAEDGGRRIADFARWAPVVDASDHVPDGSFGAGGGNSRDASDADAVANRGDEMSPRGENSEDVTNEAKFDESVTIIQNKEPVDVAANSGVDSGLDKPAEQPGRAEGQEELIGDILASSPRADAVPNRSDGMSPRGGNSENVTNEAKFDETAIIIQNKEPVGVAANSGVDSGLDKREEQPGRAERK
ncbi:MAG: hypothetical protein ACHRXM_40150, partial [Isosphaerales bacterium]